MARASAARNAAALRMTRLFQILRQHPRHQYIRAEDDHETARDHTAVGKHDDDPAGRE